MNSRKRVLHISVLRTCSDVRVGFLVFHNAVQEVVIHMYIFIHVSFVTSCNECE